MMNIFSKSAGRLRGRFWAFLLGLVLSVFAARAADSIYINTGTITSPVNVDATNFYNSGTWNIDTAGDPYDSPLPFQTADTLTYTNVGTMTGSVGWEFDFGSSTIAHSFFGGPKLSANFFNGSGGTIKANDHSIPNPENSQNPSLVSYLLIGATNIVNQGTLVAGPNGEIVLNGANVTLSRSTLETTSITGQGSSNGNTNFTPDVQVYSLFWGTNYTSFETTILWDGTNVFTGTNTSSGGLAIPFSFSVNGNVYGIPSSSSFYNGTVYNENSTCGSTNITVQIVPFTAAVGSDSTNIVATFTNIVYTNYSAGPVPTPGLAANLPVHIIRQAVFLNIGTDSGISGQVRFSPSSNPTNYGQTVAVRLSMTSTNVITLLPQTSSIYLVDTLMSNTNQGVLWTENPDPYYACAGLVGCPVNYILSRLDPGSFADGSPGGGLAPHNFFNSIIGPPSVGLPTNNIFYYSNLVSQFAAPDYTAYAAYIDNLSHDQQANGAVTNLGGRIIVNANNLNLSRADLVAGGYINIQASNLVSSANAVVSCQNLSYNLSSTNGNLNFANLASLSISQFQGNIVAWSAEWTNSMAEIITNYAYDTIASNYDIPAFITNSTAIDFYVLVVDASSLSSQVSVTVQDLSLHSTNIVISDSLNVANSFLLDGPGQTFTLLGELYLYGAIEDWTSANAPNLLYFTNNGYLYIPNNANFGNDTAVPYAEFVNNGYIDSGDQTIDSLDLQIINGINETFTGDFSATAGSIEITGPTFYPYWIYTNSIYSANDIQLSANTLLMDSAALYANGALDFNVTNSLSDANTTCFFTCYNGFNLWIKPANGDLRGSTIASIASLDREEIDHAWSGNDYGPSWAGFTNNVAIGTLALSAQNPHTNNYRLEPLFHFYGTGVSNAMYVTTLDLSGLTTNSTDVANMIQIDPNLKIYVNQVILGFTPPNGSPGQFLTNLFGGSISLVPDLVVAQSGSVDWNTVYQRIDGFGASSAWQGSWTSAQADMFFSTNTGIGLSLLRNHISAANSTLASATPSTSEFSIMQMAQARGARVWSAPWTPAAGFKSINDIYDSGQATGGGLYGGSYLGSGHNITNVNYASQLANYVASMKTNYSVNLYALSIQNEPDADITTYEACQWTGAQIRDFATNLYSALAAKGLSSTKILLPESQNWASNPGLYTPTLNDTNAAAAVGIIANHNYVMDNVTGDTTPPAELSVSNKGMWQTEVMRVNSFDGSIADGVYWARRIHAFLTVAQVNAWHYWWLVPLGTDNEGLTDNNGIPAKRMYVLGNFSRFVRPGDYRIGVNTSDSNLLVSAYMDTTSSNFAVVAINSSINVDVKQTFSLTNFPGAATVTPWITSAAYSLSNLPSIMVDNSSFSATIPAMSVVTFVGRATNGLVGSLQVTITPAAAVSAGAQWQLDGNTLQNSGTTVSNLPVGSHTLTFNPVNGWGTPASQTVTITANQTATATGTYVSQTGSLQVTITPAAAVSAGAQWQVDGGTLQNSGTTVSNLSVGSHTLTFSPVNGWGTPASQTVTITANQTTTTNGTYVQTGSLQVTLNPPGAITAGAMWQVDGGAFQSSGAIVSGLSASNHTVAYEAVNGFVTPSTQSVTITVGLTNLITGVYVSTSTNKPTVAITAPTANQSVSNVLFTVTGTVTDKVAVAGVYYTLDNSPWTNAATGNNWTNWSAAVTLIPGTNTIAAYAVDNNGSVSTTNKVSFVCVLNATLSVSTNGLGSLSPNDNGALLQIGKSYSITATAAKGFAFTNWTGGTNLPLNIITNKATIQFLMQANLMLQANFVDVTRPTNTITAPVSGQHMTSALATILGKATDNWGVSDVWYQLNNNGVWSQAATTNGWTNWTTTVKLVAGTNTIKAYALDWGGNYSATNNVSFVSSNTFKLQLGFTLAQPLTDNGLGFNLQISPGLNGHIQTSTNLLTWTTLTNFVGTNSTLNFSDPEATNFNYRFYRAVMP